MIVDPPIEQENPLEEENPPVVEKPKNKRRKRSKQSNTENILLEEAKGVIEIQPEEKEQEKGEPEEKEQEKGQPEEKEQQSEVEPIIEEKGEKDKPIIEEKGKQGEKRKNRKSLQEALQSSTESTIKVSKWSIVNAQLEKEDKIGTDIVYSFPKNRVERANVVISRK